MRHWFKGALISIGMVASAFAEDITFNQGTNFGLSTSPDGAYIAMDLQGILWVLPTRGGEAHAITSGQQPEVREPSFSPDGKKIAFQGFHAGYFHIWTVNIDGSDLKQITTGNFDDREPFWNADGNTITFSSDRTGNYDIWDIDVNTGALTQLTSHPDDAGHPHKSIDGNRLIHTREIKGDYSEIILLDDLNETPFEISLMKSESINYYRPNLYRDGIGFTYIEQDGRDISLNYVVNAFDRRTYRDKHILDQGDIFPFRGSWGRAGLYYTADGMIKFLGFKSELRNNEEWLVNVRDMVTIPFEATITANPPSYTKKIRDFDSAESQVVRGIGGLDVNPRNNRLIYSALGGMWVQDGNAPAENIDIDDIGQVNDPTWAPDGNMVAFVAERDGQMDIWTRNMISGEETRLTNDKHREYRISWSRDGSKIAYLSTRGVSNTWGRADVKVIDVEYGNIEVVDEAIHTPGRPVWARDDKHILMAVANPATSRFREGMHVIRQYHVESGRANDFEMPNDIGLSTRDGSGPVLSPDGGKLAYISEGEIRVATVDEDGNITGTLPNYCTDVALMPRWKMNSEDIFYMSGANLKSCNIRTGQISDSMINANWTRDIADAKTIHVGTLFDGVSDQVRNNVDVFVQDGRITKIAPHGTEAPIGEMIDHSGDVMIPGLMAGHTHQTELLGEKLGRNWLAYGITSVRDPGTNPYKSLMRKETWESGAAAGPRMFYAGWLTGGPRVYYGQSYNAVNEKALRHEITRARALDYDMVKSYVRLPDEYQQILIEEAHKMGIPLSSHEIAPAIQNGMDSLEHIAATSRRGYSPKFSYLANSYDDVRKIISQSGLFITATNILDGGYHKYIADHPEYVTDPKYSAFLDELQRDGQAASGNADYSKKEIEQNTPMLDTIKALYDAGANFAAGTDSPFIPYGISQHFEMLMMAEAGIPNADVIRAATINVAKNIGVDDDLGTIEVGKLADMAILSANPLDDLKNIRNVVATVKGGHHYTIEQLLQRGAE
ncbi:amidohydrolase family protein [Pseudemcibacter aquimaris]|uniref:amidohydrolase family protein n=1 Tax=Pseudemcibacter aquimaris TaxID=2857064 RepID=UPI0020127B42|nr:amidohydrolase family protein [Pseudemcibacter aquimaris]MCC3860941.1 amidohydrolase family protein [Pseudemcibacter aquimaris]WDU59760.1 amidohydrolase family protein [Pseudemcibacter aquimaris]